MEKKSTEPMTPFDELVTTPALRAVKLFIPYAPASGRQMLAAFVKLQELRQTIRVFGNTRGDMRAQTFGKTPSSLSDILLALKPYLSDRDADMADMFINLKDFMETAEILKETAPGTGDDGNFSPLDLISGMLSPEQQEAFQMYSSIFSRTPDDIRKGDDDNERMDGQSADKENGSGQT